MDLEQIAPDWNAEAALEAADQGGSADSSAITDALSKSLPLAVDALIALALNDPDGKVRLAACREHFKLCMLLGVVPVDQGGNLERFIAGVVVLQD
jgi:hypothetical protein